ncbi:MAG TPA: hypothetical protein DD413_00590 [Ruminococcus sp.]|nr:hypothetical protein [Ruminococcus sp.]
MRTKFKKLTSLCIVVIMILNVLTVAPLTAGASETDSESVGDTNTSGGFTYQVLSDGTASILYVDSDDPYIIIPETIDNITVSSIEIARGVVWGMNTLKNISIPKTVKKLNIEGNEGEVFVWKKVLENIYVNEENPVYSSYNGILMNKSQDELLCVPENYQNKDLEIPYNVSLLGKFSITLVPPLEKISFSGKEKIQISEHNLSYLPNLVEAEYPNSDAKYPLYINCPKLNKVTIPEYVEVMNDNDFSESPNVILYVYDNSYGLEWAKNHNFPYEIVKEDLDELGDVDGDGKVSIDDVTDIQKYIANTMDFTEEQMALADVDKNGTVSIDDVTLIQKHLAGMAVIE